MSRSRSFIELDDRLTAPLHGFDGADDYYARCSALGFAQRVTVPTLCLSADDDPFVAPGVTDRLRRVAPANLRIVHTARGGHVGFVGGTPWNAHYWFERLFASWMDRWAHAPAKAAENDVRAA
jgi:predicted alpha/beta-fold hydrolase